MCKKVVAIARSTFWQLAENNFFYGQLFNRV